MKTAIGLILVALTIGAVAIAQQPGRVVARKESSLSIADFSAELRQKPYRVTLIHEAQVAGQEPGVIVELSVVEGQEVKADELLGKTDDTQPRMQGWIATADHNAALEKAANDVDVRYAQKASEVAQAEWQKSIDANKRQPNVVADIDVQRQKLQWERGKLETERAESDRKIAGFTAEAKKWEINAAVAAMKRHEIRSPVDGVVEKVHLHKGEWVKPGDPVLHVVQLDRLKVEGEVEISKYSPGQLIDRPVTVEAELQGRKVQFKGKISFVSPILEALGTKYLVKAEVENRKEDGHWLLLPGLYVDMQIQTK